MPRPLVTLCNTVDAHEERWVIAKPAVRLTAEE